MEELVDVPSPRLVVIDYAETRAEQLEVMLPALAGGASPEHPVRVVLLVRAAPRRRRDWVASFRRRSDVLDAILDEIEVWMLEDDPLDLTERGALFAAAARAFAARAGSLSKPLPPESLRARIYTSPLLVVIAAYLAVHDGAADLPATRAELLEGLVVHEDRYWAATADGLGTDEALRRRVVSLATLGGAESEPEAVSLLRLLPDLAGEGTQILGCLARWVNGLYPGPRWWNPVEPDLMGEHLVATCFAQEPRILGAVLERERPASAVQPLDTYARAAPDHPQLAAAVSPQLSLALVRLCSMAVAQVAAERDLPVLIGGTTLASVLDRVAAVISVDPDVLPAAVDALPPRPDLILGPLALTLTTQLVAHHRGLAAANPARHEADLARWLNDLSVRLTESGRREEGLAASEEAVETYRSLAAANPAAYEPYLAISLNNVSGNFIEVGRREESLGPIEEAVAIRRRLAAANPAAYGPDLAMSLSNLSLRLYDTGREEESLAPIEEAVAAFRRLAAVNPAAHEPRLASSLNNLALAFGRAGHGEEALAAIEESVAIRRRLAAANPTAYEPNLAMALTNLAGEMDEAGRHQEALAVIEEAVAMCRRLATANAAAYEPDLADSLNNLSNQLAGSGLQEEALAAIEEAVAIRRRRAAANPAAYEPKLAGSLNNLSNQLAGSGLREEALAAIEEAVAICRRFAASNLMVYEPALADSLTNLSVLLGDAGQPEEGLAAIREAVAIRRRFAANLAAHRPALARALSNLSVSLVNAGRSEEAEEARSESAVVEEQINERLTRFSPRLTPASSQPTSESSSDIPAARPQRSAHSGFSSSFPFRAPPSTSSRPALQ